MTMTPDKTVLAVMAIGKRAAEKLDRKSASRVALPMTCCATRAQAPIVAATTGDAIPSAPSPSRAPLVGIARLYSANPQINAFDPGKADRRMAQAAIEELRSDGDVA
jgi:hypothetical protein